MDTKERVAGLQKEYIEGAVELNKIVKKKQVSNNDKPKMYQKVRETLAFVNSDLSKDIIEHRGE